MIEEIGKIKSGNKELRDFGLTVGGVLVILGVIAACRQKAFYGYLLTAGALLIASGLLVPKLLKPLQKVWMALAIVLGFVVSHIVLIILFYAVITPIGLIARGMGNDILDERIDKKRRSYWRKRDNTLKTKASYEKQF